MALMTIPAWCAALKVCFVATPKDYTEADHKAAVKRAAEEERGALVLSVNWNDRESLIPHLESLGWSKSRWVKNWGHYGRKTCLMYYTITISDIKKHNPVCYRRIKRREKLARVN